MKISLVLPILLLLFAYGCSSTPEVVLTKTYYQDTSDSYLCYTKYNPDFKSWGSLRSTKFRLSAYALILEESYKRNLDCSAIEHSDPKTNSNAETGISWMENSVMQLMPYYADLYLGAGTRERLVKLKSEHDKNIRLTRQKTLKESQQTLLESKKDKCRTYGFEDATEGMGMCLIELDKLAELEKQTLAIETNSQAQTEALAKQEAEEKNRREAQALINLGNVLSGKKWLYL